MILVNKNFKENSRIHESRLAGAFLALKAKWKWKTKLKKYRCEPGDVTNRMNSIIRHEIIFRNAIIFNSIYQQRA